MSVSSKCYYALRAVYALADHAGPEPMKIAEIAEKEQIPIRFLEVILNQLKGGGFVQSRRGAEGGYRLARPADQLTVGEIMRYIDGPIAPVDCVSQTRPKVCEFPGGCHFYSFWARVRQAISDVVDKTTFADLIRESRERGTRLYRRLDYLAGSSPKPSNAECSGRCMVGVRSLCGFSVLCLLGFRVRCLSSAGKSSAPLGDRGNERLG